MIIAVITTFFEHEGCLVPSPMDIICRPVLETDSPWIWDRTPPTPHPAQSVLRISLDRIEFDTIIKPSYKRATNPFGERTMSKWHEEFRPEMEKHCEYAMYMGGPQPPTDTSVMIVPNTAETYHFVLPPDPNAQLSDTDLSAVACAEVPPAEAVWSAASEAAEAPPTTGAIAVAVHRCGYRRRRSQAPYRMHDRPDSDGNGSLRSDTASRLRDQAWSRAHFPSSGPSVHRGR